MYTVRQRFTVDIIHLTDIHKNWLSLNHQLLGKDGRTVLLHRKHPQFERQPQKARDLKIDCRKFACKSPSTAKSRVKRQTALGGVAYLHIESVYLRVCSNYSVAFERVTHHVMSAYPSSAL